MGRVNVAKIAMLDNVKESSERGAGWYTRLRRFITDARAELTRVTWPNRREVWATTVVVILVSLVFGLYLYLVDLGLSAIVAWIFGKVGA
jgi:preprotein translocase subunit SecE